MKHAIGSTFGYVVAGKYKFCYVGSRPEVIKMIDFNPKHEMLTFWECHDNIMRNGYPLPKTCIEDVPFSAIASYEKEEQPDSYIYKLNWKSGETTEIRADVNELLVKTMKAKTKRRRIF